MTQKNPSPIKPPRRSELRAIRLMIVVGVVSVIFFLYSMFQSSNISYLPLYVLLMITMLYYCLKYLHEWYHYFSISAPEKPETDRIYTVDMLTTYCAGEPFDMLEQTLTAIQAITYPHTAWCCDEADDPGVKALCIRLGVKHVTRTIKKDAKAGNINNALQYATGELCVVLDPDHVPVPEFLDRVVAYFDDPAIGYVQVVQAYYNQSESLVAKGAAQQTYQFYGPMMMGMHRYNTVQAIGANCTFRRAALDSIGGHASGLSEDMHTAMQMHAKGWRSVYVPEILTRGLVPATMSSYFKQQLKWSRGTWELLLVTYPKLFRKFNLRQKIHYATLPFHYLSGFIFLINFLIPVVSLFTGYIPLKMDIVSFALAAFPIFAMGILIRHYVQKWVAEESDRGFHLVGGILQIGAWWIFSVGVVYTFFRKKVPYIPTPKNDNEPLPFILNLPNFIVALISAVAIFYGLLYDYTPYTIFMVILASMQILFMIFIFSISGYTSSTSKVNNVMTRLREKTWLIKKTHGFLRRFSVPLSFLVIAIFILGYVRQTKLPTFLPEPLPGLQVFYRGVYTPAADREKKTDLNLNGTAAAKRDVAIIAFDLPWGDGDTSGVDIDALQKIYSQQKIPLINWHLLQHASSSKATRGDLSFSPQHITRGDYDKEIQLLADQVAALQKPIFLSCANGAFQGRQTVFTQSAGTADEYIWAIRHIHDIFEKAAATKVIWIWSPETATAANLFPGKQYVDWLGVKISAAGATGSVMNSFDSLYRPFHDNPLFTTGLPVMIFQSEAAVNVDQRWWKTAWGNLDTTFKEIKAIVARVEPKSGIVAAFSDNSSGTKAIAAAPVITTALPQVTTAPSVPVNYSDTAKGVVYDKGYYWFRNRHTMTLKTIQDDVTLMKSIGINTIERTMPGLYDNKLMQVIERSRMNLVPRFWLLPTPEVIADDARLAHQKKIILSFVKANKDKKLITGWNVSQDVLYSLAGQVFKPDYFYYEQKYVGWLADVCREIRRIDSLRPIMIDLHWDEKGKTRFDYYKQHLPLVNVYRLSADEKYRQGLKIPLEKNMVWGKVPVELWHLLPASQKAVIPEWQDLENTDFISMNGLLDMEGRKKEWFHLVRNSWTTNRMSLPAIPEIQILKPAKTIWAKHTLFYQLLHRKTGSLWTVFDKKEKEIRFEWYLVRTDQYGNTMFIKKAGEGPFLQIQIPEEPEYYKLYVEAVVKDNVKMAHSSLNIPLR